MAYFLWENDGRNAHERPDGRSLPDLVRRRLNNQPPPESLFAGPEATQRSLFHIPSASRSYTSSADADKSTSDIIKSAQEQAAQTKGQRGSDLRALRTAVTDEWNQANSSLRP